MVFKAGKHFCLSTLKRDQGFGLELPKQILYFYIIEGYELTDFDNKKNYTM